MQRKPPPKVLDADERKRNQARAVRVEQYTALYLMRQLQACTDEFDAMPAIDWMNLDDREFVKLTEQQQQRLPKANQVLRVLLQNKTATDVQMQRALTAEQHTQYKNSFDFAVSHAEDEWDNRPQELDEYLRLLKLGDLLSGLSERISARARLSAKGIRYNSRGQTTSTSVWHKAEKHYEEALMYLRGECENTVAATQLQKWFDRPLDFDPNTGTLSADAVGVPRLRGSLSHNCLDKTRNIWGSAKRKYYRQRESITESVYAMLFNDDAENEEKNVVVSKKLQELLREIHPERDWE